MDSVEKPAAEHESPAQSFLKGFRGSNHGASDTTLVMSKADNGSDHSNLDLPLRSPFNASNDTLNHRSDDDLASMLYQSNVSRSCSPAPPRTWRSKAGNAWQEHKGVILMILAQFFGSAMAAVARLLETNSSDQPPMNPFQIIFARQSVTVVFSLLYMWWAEVEDAPMGPRIVRPVLALRGFGGFFGVVGLYFSLIYLPLADAIVMTFIAPMLAAYIGSFIMKTPFARSQQIAGIISFFGVILITRPFSIFYSLTSSDNSPPFTTNSTLEEPSSSSNSTTNRSTAHFYIPPATPLQRGFAVLMGLLGVIGASCAYVTISWIGKRAHPLISVTYFSGWCTFISLIALIFVPSVPFRLPTSLREWNLLSSLGITGFIMQFLLTSSLAHKRSNRVLNIVYVQMLFALGFDKIIWDESPGWMSLVGSGLILGSVIWVAIRKDSEQQGKRPEVDRETGEVPEEEERLVSDVDDEPRRSSAEHDARRSGSEEERIAEMQFFPSRR